MANTVDQDYKTLTTPESKTTIKIRTYTTGADEEAIKEAIATGTDLTVNEQNEAVAHVDANAEQKINRVVVERFVVEIDGKDNNVSSRFYDLRTPDFRYALEELKKITNDIGGLEDAKKKK